MSPVTLNRRRPPDDPPAVKHPETSASEDDATLLRRIAGGDRDAFETLYRRYHRRLHGYLRHWLRDASTIEEVLDDTLFVVWADAARFEGRSRVSTWIFGIAYRKAQQAVRTAPPETAEIRPDSQTAEPTADRLALHLALRKAISRLSPDHRAVVELTYFEDCSYQEIAAIVDCPVNTVKTRMFHARRHLRRILPTLGWTPA